MERKTDPKSLNRDGYSMTLSIPRALIAIPNISFREALIISKIVGLSSKYVDKGGCNLTNDQLAKRHRCSKPTVANAISKAKWLGLQEDRSDEVKTFTTESGDIAYIQNRKLKMTIPQIWEFFGEVWGEFYFNGCPAAETMLDWLNEKLPNMENKQDKEYLDIKELLDQFNYQFFTDEGLKELDKKYSKGGIWKILNPNLENFKPPFEKLYALYVYGFKFSDLSSRIVSEAKTSDSDNDSPNQTSPNQTGIPNNSTPKERAKEYLPQAESLKEVVQSEKNIKINQSKLNSWANEVRKLVETDGVELSRINTALDWYSNNVGGEYIPQIESGSTLRNKFTRLEDAMRRGNNNNDNKSTGRKPSQGFRSGRKYDHSKADTITNN